MNKLRTLAIVDYVKQRKYCSSSELAKAFGISPATVQRDIAEIVKQNRLRKVHGGVAILEASQQLNTPAPNSHFTERIEVNPEKKDLIASLAEKQIENGDILFLDSSTTALHLARHLQRSNFANLTIVTNSVLIIREFYLFPPHFVLISVGGSFNFQLNSFLGRTAIENLRQLRITKAFFSAVGINKEGIFTYHENHAEFINLITQIAESAYLLLDSTKFNKTALFPICSSEHITSLITDAQPPADIAQFIPKTIYWEPSASFHPGGLSPVLEPSLTTD